MEKGRGRPEKQCEREGNETRKGNNPENEVLVPRLLEEELQRYERKRKG